MSHLDIKLDTTLLTNLLPIKSLLKNAILKNAFSIFIEEQDFGFLSFSDIWFPF